MILQLGADLSNRKLAFPEDYVMTPQIDMILSQRKRDIIAEIKSLVRPDGKSKTAALLSEYEQVTHL
jgi:hypothetical protein